jgi:hypothetical protein
MFRHYIAILRERFYCLMGDAQLRSSRQNIVDERVVTLPEDGNVMPKHVGGTVHN